MERGKFTVAKFIRDDGVSLEIDERNFYLEADNTLLVRADPETTVVSYTEANGGEMLAQRLTTVEQPITGLLVPKQTSYWRLVQQLTAFWKINHTYKIIYRKMDGAMFAVDDLWISSALQIIPTPNQSYSKWSVGLTIGNEIWREYAEDANGNEIDANMVTLPSLSNSAGGEQWDDIGLVYDDIGAVWLDDGSSGLQDIMVESIKPVYPVWTVLGPCVKPKLQNNTTDTEATYNGTVATGQTLVVNFEAGEAHLDGALVTRLVDGVIKCDPGSNQIGFSSDDSTAKECIISWDNIIG